jgi:hypothetical protein
MTTMDHLIEWLADLRTQKTMPAPLRPERRRPIVPKDPLLEVRGPVEHTGHLIALYFCADPNDHAVWSHDLCCDRWTQFKARTK